MKVAILGAGGVALGTAAWLCSRGVEAVLWSPSGRSLTALAGGKPLTATGALEGTFHPGVAASVEEAVDSADVVLVALPAYAHAMAFEAVAPHLTNNHVVAISSHASFGALALARRLAARGLAPPIVAWGTTLTAGRRKGEDTVAVSTVRKSVDVGALPKSAAPAALDTLIAAFGDHFRPRDGVLAIALSNLNPQNHLAIALCNYTRMEQGESWKQAEHIPAGVGRLMEALDAERLAIADAFGVETRTIFDHFSLSYHLEKAPVSEMYAALLARGGGAMGPTTADTRYVTEDVPYGLVPTAWLGALVGRPAVLHDAGTALFSAIYGRDFVTENDLLDAAGVRDLHPDALRRLCDEGVPIS